MTFPARQCSVNGERRSFALLRPANGELSAQEAIRQCILDAVQPRPGSRLIGQRSPRRCGLSPAAWGRVVASWVKERDAFAGLSGGVRERKEPWRP